MFSLASSVICYCYEEAEMLQDVFPEKAILVAGNSALSQRDCRVLDSPEPKRTNVLFIGRLIPEKKGLLLLEAIARLQQNNIDVGAVIIGEGPELSTMREIARNLGLRNINFAGFHNEIDEIRELAESTFAMVSPGYIGLSVVHSLSMGLPFIYSIDEPNAPEVEVSRIGWNSMNFRGGDSSDLATKIASVFHDRGSWLARGNAFCELIKSKYSVEQMANRFVNFFLN
jgi:glycosyltransferase involved in cell wall biosynthesis